jgi:hypothetical protein
MGVTSTKSGRLEVNLSLSEKRGGKSQLGTILLSAVSLEILYGHPIYKLYSCIHQNMYVHTITHMYASKNIYVYTNISCIHHPTALAVG